jgi:HK97 family phage portal protein
MDAFSKACDRADAMLACARSNIAAKAAGLSNVSDMLVGSNLSGAERRMSFGAASEQYAACKNWVFPAVRLIASRIAGQPIHIARERGRPSGKGMFKGLGDTDNLEPLDQHPILDLLSDPSEMMTAWSLMWTTVAGLSLTGRALWLYGEENGRDALLPIPLTWVESTDTRRTIWNIRPGGTGTAIPVPGEFVAHFYMPDPADPYGAMSPLVQAALAVETDNAIAECQLQTFLRGIMPRIALRVGKTGGMPGVSGSDRRITLTQPQRKQIVEAIRSAHAGFSRSEEPLILDNLIEEVFKLSTAPAEMGFMESGASTKERVLQSFGVSPILLGQVEGANRASATVADYNVVSNTVNPIITMLSLTMTEWLGPLYAKPNERLRIWIEPCVAHDAEMHLKQWESGGRLGYVTPNEFRRAVLNLTDIEGGDELPSAGKPTPATTPTAPDAAKPDTSVNTQQQIQVAPELTLNGAQIAAASAIVQSVADNKISRDSGIGQLMVLLNLTEEQAERVMGSVGEGFVATTSTEKATELEQMLDPLLNPYTLERLKDGSGRTTKVLAKATRSRRKGPGK